MIGILLNKKNNWALILVVSLAFGVIGCGGGGSPDPAGLTPVNTFNLQCDLTVSYTPGTAPEISSGAGAITTVIALHGKSGAPTRSHMQSLAADLNAQGYDVVMPYMPWSELEWDGTLCDSISYIDSLVATEIMSGNSVILLGHSMAGPIVLSYAALANTTKPDALTVLAPGHYVPNSSVLANAHAPSIQLAKDDIAAGLGDTNNTFQTLNGGVLGNITTTPNIYLSFHDNAQLPDQLPDINTSIPLVSVSTLWLAGLADPLTAVTKNLGIINTVSASSFYTYKEITGDHFSLVDNVTAELDPWFQGL